MAKRVTIMLDDDVDKALRTLQAKLIRDTSDSVSFSQVINETLGRELKRK